MQRKAPQPRKSQSRKSSRKLPSRRSSRKLPSRRPPLRNPWLAERKDANALTVNAAQTANAEPTALKLAAQLKKLAAAERNES